MTGWEIFEGKHSKGAYQFFMEHVGLTCTDVVRTYENGVWTLTQTDETGTYSASSRDHRGAVLLLIAARVGLALPEGVDFEDVP